MSTTIRKGLRVIEYLAHAGGPRGISEIARRIGMNKSAVQRIISTLKETGYVEKAHDTAKYRLTLSIWELGSHVVDQYQVRRLVHPVLRFAAQSPGFTAFLTCLSFPFVVYIDKVEGAHGRVHTAEPGSRIPMTRTAAGRAILAFLPDRDLIELARNHTDWTGYVVSKAMPTVEFAEEMPRIRRRRFATSQGGLKPGVNSIAAPVWWRDACPYGSIVLTADESNLPRERFGEIGARVVAMASEATLALGGTAFPR